MKPRRLARPTDDPAERSLTTRCEGHGHLSQATYEPSRAPTSPLQLTPCDASDTIRGTHGLA